MGTDNNNFEANDEIQIDLVEVFFYVWEHIWVVILCTLICGISAYVVSAYFMTEKYESTTTVWVMSESSSTTTVTYSDLQASSQLANDYIEILTSRYVLETVIENLDLTDETATSLEERITTALVDDTRMITITVTDKDPELAATIANEIVEVTAERIEDVIKLDQLEVTLVDEAVAATEPSSPDVPKYTLLGFFGGIFISVAVIVIKFLLDDTIKSDDDMERYLGVTPLASIPQIEEPGKKKKMIKIPDKVKLPRAVSKKAGD